MRIRLIAIGMLLLLSAAAMTAGQTGSDLYQQGLARETAGDLKGAIQIFERIVRDASSDRALTARALLQLGRWSDLLGHDQARKYYEQVIRDYADQPEAVGQARARLAALGASEATFAASPSNATSLPRVDENNEVMALSPDGTKALFIDYSKGENLSIYDFVARRARLLTDFDWTSTGAYTGVWSPDGRRVAYTQRNFGRNAVHELRVATLDGDATVVFRNEANPGKDVIPAAWLPDGRLLVTLERADNTMTIGFVPAAGGPFTPLRSLQWATYGGQPRVSPDAKFAAFTDGPPGAHDIYVIRLDGTAVYRITDHPADDAQPMWAPDGRQLVFVSTRSGTPALWMVTIKDGARVDEPVQVREGMQNVNLIDWTVRGLVYGQTQHLQDIYVMSIDSSSMAVGKPQLLSYRRTGRNYDPVWSPDGRYLAFVSASVAEPDRRSIVVLTDGRADGREYPIPTTRFGNAEQPSDLRWFGDSSGLGFSGTDAQGRRTVFRLSLVAGQWQTYPAPDEMWGYVEWNTDGSKYFFVREASGGRPYAIVEHDLATGRDREIHKAAQTDVDTGFFDLAFSPDRRLLAFRATAPRDGHPAGGLMVLSIETGEARTLANELGAPAWSPDGRALLVARNAGRSRPELQVVPIDGGARRSVTLDDVLARGAAARAEGQPFIERAGWSPDGTRITFGLSVYRKDTWVVQNVLAGIGSRGGRR